MVNFILQVMLLANAYLYPALKEQMEKASPEDKIEAIVHLKASPDYEGMKGLSPSLYVDELKRFCENSQREIITNISENFSDKVETLVPYWIFNGFYIKATKDVIEWIAKRDEVDYIVDNYEIKLQAATPSGEIKDDIKAPTWNISKVKADSCWSMGYDGSGIVVGVMDTGADTSHPAIRGKFLGYWFDAITGYSNPIDDYGHGTHCTGTILGGDGLGPFSNDIGVAPGARFVSVKIFNSQGSSTVNAIHAGFQKIAEWKGQGVDIKVVSNSWGSTDAASTEYWNDVINWRNLGIVPVFAAGNNGPGSGTINSPGSYPTTIAVGATDNGDNIANFSCRGPAPTGSPWNNTQYWPRSDWNFIKPNISAPGVSVPSSVPGGSYESWDGTSMATPHVAGAIAILLQKNPNLDFYQIYSILLDNADQPSQGAPYPNNNYGWGRLNVYRALLNTPTPDAPALVLLNYSFNDTNGNSLWDPGEEISVTVTIKNNGSDAQNVNAVLRTTSSYATITDSTYFWSSIPTNSQVTNEGDPFIVVSSPATPSGTSVPFTLYLSCEGGYEWSYNFNLVVGVPPQDYADHTPGNIVLTVTKYGALGYMSSQGTQGSGCRYPSNSASHLYYGSFAVGTTYPYVIDRYYESSNGDDADWVTLQDPDGRVFMNRPYPPYYEYSQAIFSDAGAGSLAKGLIVYQRGYTFNDNVGKNFVILEYTLYNSSANPINGLYTGLFTDWDIGNASSNTGGVDTTRHLAYLYYSTTFMGTAIINPSRLQRPLISNWSVIDHDAYVYPYNGLPDSIEIKFLNGTYRMLTTNRSYDWSTVVSAGPLDIPPYDSVKVAFVVAGANTLGNLRSYVDSAYVRYWDVMTDVCESQNGGIRISSISKGVLNFSAVTSGEAKVSVFDVKGARVANYTVSVQNNMARVDLRNLPAGIYIVRVEAGGYLEQRKVILVR